MMRAPRMLVVASLAIGLLARSVPVNAEIWTLNFYSEAPVAWRWTAPSEGLSTREQCLKQAARFYEIKKEEWQGQEVKGECKLLETTPFDANTIKQLAR